MHKLSAFKYVILTEHLPNGDFIHNKDIISGLGIRLKKQSGLHLAEPPFNFKVKVKVKKKLLSYKVAEEKALIVTTFYEVF